MGCVLKMEKNADLFSFGKQELVIQRKENKKVKSKLSFILLFCFVTFSLLLFLRSSFFAVEEISIKGVDKVPVEDIRAATGIKEGMNIWKISPPVLRNRILLIPRIAGVDVKRELPDKLIITVEEKQPVVMISHHDHFLELAADGMIIGLKKTYRGELPLVNGFSRNSIEVGTTISDLPRGEILEVFLKAFQAIPTLPIAEINLEEPQQIMLYTKEGMEVWLGNDNNLLDKLEILQYINNRLLQNEHKEGYLDLRTADAPVFKPF
jgi:cell division protein FtsQ